MRVDVVKRLLHQWAEENCSDSGVSKNRKRVVKRVMDRLDRFADEESIQQADLEEFLYDETLNKEELGRVLDEFYRYVLNQGFEPGENHLDEKILIDDRARRQAALIPYLKYGAAAGELEDRFCISRRTLMRDLADLRHGIDFMGLPIQADVELSDGRYLIRDNGQKYPMFLMMNAGEFAALTYGLRWMMADPLYGDAARKMCENLSLNQERRAAFSLDGENSLISAALRPTGMEAHDREFYKDLRIMLETGCEGRFSVLTKPQIFDEPGHVITYDQAGHIVTLDLKKRGRIAVDVAMIAHAELVSEREE